MILITAPARQTSFISGKTLVAVLFTKWRIGVSQALQGEDCLTMDTGTRPTDVTSHSRRLFMVLK